MLSELKSWLDFYDGCLFLIFGWPQWRNSIACRPWISAILPLPTLRWSASLTKHFSWTLLAVHKSKCVCCMLMRAECHCKKCISTGSLTFCKARHAIATKPTNNVTFREIGVKRYQRVRKFPLHECPQDWASDSHKEQILLLNWSPLFCVVRRNGFLMSWRPCHKLDFCISLYPRHFHEAHWE